MKYLRMKKISQNEDLGVKISACFGANVIILLNKNFLLHINTIAPKNHRTKILNNKCFTHRII